MTTAGLLLSVVGIAVMYVGYSRTETVHYPYLGDIEEPAPNYGLVTIGGIASSLGTGMFYAAIIRSSKNWAPCSTVQSIAEEYNRKLMIEIQREF